MVPATGLGAKQITKETERKGGGGRAKENSKRV